MESEIECGTRDQIVTPVQDGGWLHKLGRCCDSARGILLSTWKVIWAAKFPVLVSVLIFGLLLVDQSKEALRVIAETTGDFNWLLLWACAAAVTGSLHAWYFTRVLLNLLFRDGSHTRYESWLKTHFPRILGCLPCAGLAAAAFLSRVPGNPATQPVNRNLLIFGLIQCALVILLYLFFMKRREYMQKHPTLKKAAPKSVVFPFDWSQWIPVGGATLLWVVFFILFTFMPVPTGRALGPIAVLILGTGLWIPLGSFIGYLGSITRVPFLTLLVLAALLFTIFDWNDNHPVRTVAGSGAPKLLDVSESFQDWLANRPDLPDFANRPYPVFLVATEGGGVRAAYNTAMILGGLQDRYPNFRHHVFAISGVSGGSVGAGIFAASLKEQMNPSAGAATNLQAQAHEVFSSDLLSPVIGAGLFPDLAQRFLPVAIPYLDRGRALEGAFEAAWKEQARSGFGLDQSFFSLYGSFTNESVPALLLNTTQVETGQRMAASPFNPSSFHLSRPLGLSEVASNPNIPLSAAMSLSARFPIVTPAGYCLKEEGGEEVKRRFVDGGYFENSGTATALDLYSVLNLTPEGLQIPYELVVIRIGHKLTFGSKAVTAMTNTASLPKHRAQGMGELSPLRAMFNTREARGEAATKQLESTIMSSTNHSLIHFEWEMDQIPLPLGWLISRMAAADLSRQFTSSPGIQEVGRKLGARASIAPEP